MMDGIILLNKEKGYSSRDYGTKCAKALGEKRCGHTGTLDPLATGLLVLLLGSYTKLNDYINTNIKEYIVTLRLGIKTDTYDIEGKILDEKDVTFDEAKFYQAIDVLKNKKTQIPPIYSAIKVNGKKLYHYARNNEKVDLPERDASIYELEVLNIINKDSNRPEIKIRLKVSKGYYIRSFVFDLGELLGTNAVMINLERTKAGIFKIEDSSTIEDIKMNKYHLYKIEDVFSLPRIDVNLFLAKKIANGLQLDSREFDGDSMFFVYYDNHLIALYKPVENNLYSAIWKDGDYLANL